jgi:membrane-bound lytic murein transglycosylase
MFVIQFLGSVFMRRESKNLKADFNTTHSDLMRDKLLREISDYERQLAELKLNGAQVNFTMIQTYKELISARQAMLKRLPVHY